jgi:hypothetical protein
VLRSFCPSFVLHLGVTVVIELRFVDDRRRR